MSGRQKFFSVIGIVVLIVLIVYSPYERNTGEFSKILYALGDCQEQASENITNAVVSKVEGSNTVGEHCINGSNWSIPNIVRHLLGVE